jgi:hypothetical protein
MMCVSVEVHEGALTRRARVSRPYIEHALKIAGGDKPGRGARSVFPIDPEPLFAPTGLGRKKAA